MKHYTSIEQSIHLEKLGLDIITADMFYNEEPDENYPKDIIDTKYPMVIREGQKHHLLEYGVPCWSLDALLEVMPPSIEKYDNINGCGCRKNYGLNLFRSYYHCCGYSFGPSLKEENHDTLCCFGCDSWIDAAYKTVVWLIENGYIKTK